jgi:hypothetical protein
MLDHRIILLEFNELCPSLMYRFMASGHLPHFRQLHDGSAVYTTRARERAPDLDPWIQWTTVHTGLNFDRHHIARLDEGESCAAKRIWDFVSEQGGTAWICGSMSASYRPGFKGALIPDPWTTKVAPTPERFRPYFDFVQNSVLDSTNRRPSMSRRQAAEFARFMACHGLSARTVTHVASQLLSEWRGRDRWKRAVILDRLQFDLFRRHWLRERPTFSTLFLNSTAHFQHLHWREMEPELFEMRPTAAEIDEYRSAILFGYRNMDSLLARVLKMADRRTTVVLATALSQQPCLAYEHQGGKAFYRPIDFRSLLSFAGVTAYRSVAPVMAHQFHVEFGSELAARAAQERLAALRVDDRGALSVECHGNRLFAWCPITTAVAPSAVLHVAAGEHHRRETFSTVFYKVDGIKSGMHHPDGLLWIRRPDSRHQVFQDPVDLDLVAPTLLAELGITPPEWMRRPIPGRSAVSSPQAPLLPVRTAHQAI